MNIYKYAMKMEKDSENYYRELANKTGDLGLQNILKMLANDEVKHYHICLLYTSQSPRDRQRSRMPSSA